MGYGVQAGQLRFLQGESVKRVGAVNGDTSPMPEELLGDGMVPYPGTDLRLTIDRTVQAYVEGELDRAMAEYQAEGGTILVMDTRTGALIALASRPTYEPARYADYAAEGREQLFRDPAVSVP
jgi:cell division protein FtsI/penicillin-binding protein 2